MLSMATRSIFDCDSPPTNQPSRELVSYDDDDLFTFGGAMPNDEINSATQNVSISVTVDSTKRCIKRKSHNVPKPTNGYTKKRIVNTQNKPNGTAPRKYDNDPSSGEYHLLKEIGSGTYGQVYKAELQNKVVIAVKRLHINLNSPNLKTKLDFTKREYNNLHELEDCVYIVRLFKGREEKLSKNELQVDLLFEYCPHDLRKIIAKRTIVFQLSEIKGFLRQMLVGLDYMHTKSIMHRDFKTENILLTVDGVLKIADFGLSRKFRDPSALLGKEQYTPTVVTQWYRAPEILLGQSYSELCDMWSFGCVMGEFWHRAAILQGENDIGQIKLISRLCGSDGLSQHLKIQLPKDSRKTRFFLKDKMPKVPGDEANILFDKLLQCNPEKRLNASKALNDHFFYTDPLPSKCLKSFMNSIIPILCSRN